jgi:SAM-dependent methyltransferase
MYATGHFETEIPCPLCAGAEFDVVGKRGRDGAPLRTVLCRACGLVFSNPMPAAEALDAYYRRSYRLAYKGVLAPRLKHVHRAALRAIPRWQRLRALRAPNGRLLDVGSGGGEFLYLARRLGFTVCGLEPNEGYARFAREQYGLEVCVDTLETAEFAPASFDVITVNHVLEHLRDPGAALATLGRWLAAEGVLIVEVPNIEAHYHAPRTRFHFAHLYHFSRATLLEFGMRAGLAPRNVALVPGVLHLNVAFGKATFDARPSIAGRQHASQVAAGLRAQTALRHYLSMTPYRRLIGNVARPLRERVALRGVGSAREVLDRVFSAVAVGPAAANTDST